MNEGGAKSLHLSLLSLAYTPLSTASSTHPVPAKCSFTKASQLAKDRRGLACEQLNHGRMESLSLHSTGSNWGPPSAQDYTAV